MADPPSQKLSGFTLSRGKVVPLLKAKRGRGRTLEDDQLRLYAFFRAEERERRRQSFSKPAAAAARGAVLSADNNSEIGALNE